MLKIMLRWTTKTFPWITDLRIVEKYILKNKNVLSIHTLIVRILLGMLIKCNIFWNFDKKSITFHFPRYTQTYSYSSCMESYSCLMIWCLWCRDSNLLANAPRQMLSGHRLWMLTREKLHVKITLHLWHTLNLHIIHSREMAFD